MSGILIGPSRSEKRVVNSSLMLAVHCRIACSSVCHRYPPVPLEIAHLNQRCVLLSNEVSGSAYDYRHLPRFSY
jgi:hypothetical protein